MANTSTIESNQPASPMIEIVEEIELGGHAEACLSVDGKLTIVVDVTVPEADQVYVYLHEQQVQALISFLQQQNA